MYIHPIAELPSSPGSRIAREPGQRGVRRDELAGSARPGDVITLAGGALVYDVNANGRVDGGDAGIHSPAKAQGARIDVLA